jgi:hypothetical protein
MPAEENQSPRGGLRQCQRRSGIFEDVVPFPCSEDYESADLVTTRAGATWGAPVDVRGRDEVTLLVSVTVVAGMTGLVIAFQDGYSDGEADAVWYDRHAAWNQEQGDNVAIPATPRDLTLDVSGFAAGTHLLSVALKVRGHYMRFKPYGAGTVTASRCTLKGLRLSRSG